MRFTIVTIAYNQQKFVDAAIRSVLDQDYPDLEYIVVDPGSTDGTRSVIERYRDRLAHVLYMPDDGPADGLNNGFLSATGDLFGFLNSDDLLMPGTLSKVARVFESEPDVDLVMGHLWVIDEDGRPMRRAYSDRFSMRAYGYGTCTICQPSTFFRASIFQRAGGFNIANRVAWDSELFLDMMQYARRHEILDETLSAFRVYDGSITGSPHLGELKRRFFNQRFERIFGRKWRRSDKAMMLLYLARKYLLEPRSLRERLVHGSILGSGPRADKWGKKRPISARQDQTP